MTLLTPSELELAVALRKFAIGIQAVCTTLTHMAADSDTAYWHRVAASDPENGSIVTLREIPVVRPWFGHKDGMTNAQRAFYLHGTGRTMFVEVNQWF